MSTTTETGNGAVENDISDIQRSHLAGVVRRARQPRPEPAPRAVSHPIFSVDDHLLEDPELFIRHMPARYAESAPRVVEDEVGMEHWQFEDVHVENSGGNVMGATWEVGERYAGPIRYDEARLGTYDVDARVRDMDIAGVVASVCFPSMNFGFCGQRFARFRDQELGLASMRAYNEWIVEEWVGAHPTRLVPQQVTWLNDPSIAADEIRRNAERGFKAVTFSENPAALGLPPIRDRAWDPFLRACEETDTVIDLHVGSSSRTMAPAADSPLDVLQAVIPLNAYVATADWLFSGVPTRFPRLKVVMSESCIGWLPMLYDRIAWGLGKFQHGGDGGVNTSWSDPELTPLEVLRRNFWFTTFFDPSSFGQLPLIGEDRVMFEVDYPHSDTSWPDTQEIVGEQLAGLTREAQQRLAWRNASELYRHPVDVTSA